MWLKKLKTQVLAWLGIDIISRKQIKMQRKLNKMDADLLLLLRSLKAMDPNTLNGVLRRIETVEQTIREGKRNVA